MRAIFTLLFFLVAKVAAGQAIEQKAIIYLLDNIDSIFVKYAGEDTIGFNKTANKIWYHPRIRGEKQDVKLSVKGAMMSSEEWFYKVKRGEKDIFIITHLSEKNEEGYTVNFVIATNYRIYTQCVVYFDREGNPLRIEQKEELPEIAQSDETDEGENGEAVSPGNTEE